MAEMNYIKQYADCVTVHTICGEGTIESMKNIFNTKNLPIHTPIGIITICEMSSKDNLIDNVYKTKSIELSRKHNITGVVLRNNNLEFEFELATFTPGINLDKKHDESNQTYINPLNKKREQTHQPFKSGLFWIIGRGITQSNDINNINYINKCKEYSELGWDHFINY